jgi:hypothetical protein
MSAWVELWCRGDDEPAMRARWEAYCRDQITAQVEANDDLVELIGGPAFIAPVVDLMLQSAKPVLDPMFERLMTEGPLH